MREFYNDMPWLCWLVGILFALVLLAIACDSIERTRLIEQCIEDGNKEYQCKSMFYVHARSTY